MVIARPITPVKLAPPAPVSGALVRARLIEHLERGTRRQLTVLNAAAGSGKTQLLATWLASAAPGQPVAWLTVDAQDREPEAFWSCVFEALRGCTTVPDDHPPDEPVAGDEVARRVQLCALATELCARAVPLVLVLDDFHTLAGSTVADELEFLLHRAAPGLRLVVATRVEPQLPVHRYRLADELSEIRTDDLAFTVTETEELLQRWGSSAVMDAHALHAATEGWAAGIRMTALAQGPSPDGARVQHRYIDEYLSAEVLDGLSGEVRDFLIRTSVVETLWPELATELSGRPDSANLLTRLARTNGFVRAVADGGRCYRYHPQLRRLLITELESGSPGLARDQRSRAARWLARYRTVGEAVALAAADDVSLAAALVVEAGALPEVWAAPDRSTLANAFATVSDSGGAPDLAVVLAGVALGVGDVSTCARNLATVSEASVSDDARDLAAALVEAQLGVMRADPSAAQEAAGRAEALLVARNNSGGRDAACWIALLSASGAALLWNGAATAAIERLRRGCDIAERVGDSHARVSMLAQLAVAELIAGHRRRARTCATTAVALADELGLGPAQRPPAAAIALGWVCAEEGNSGAAQVHAKQAAVAAAWLTRDPIAAALLSRLQWRLRRHRQPYLCADGGSGAVTVPTWLDERFGVAPVAGAVRRVARTGTHGGGVSADVLVETVPARSVGVVTRLSAVPPDRSRLPGGSELPIVIEPLTQKEHEVLRHLADALSTEEVAQTMFVSVNTVRTHVRGILRKLAASRRNEAIRRARQLELI